MGQIEVSDRRKISVSGLSLSPFCRHQVLGRGEAASLPRRLQIRASNAVLLPVVMKIVDASDIRCEQLGPEEHSDLAPAEHSGPGPFGHLADAVSDGRVEALDLVSLPVEPSLLGSSIKMRSGDLNAGPGGIAM